MSTGLKAFALVKMLLENGSIKEKDVFSARYNTSQAAHYYLAENEGNVSYLQDVTDNIDTIYKKLSEPMQMLENLRYSTD